MLQQLQAPTMWGVAKGSSISLVAKFKGDKGSECRLSNGGREVTGDKTFLFHGNREFEWSRSYRVTGQAGGWQVLSRGLSGDRIASVATRVPT